MLAHMDDSSTLFLMYCSGTSVADVNGEQLGRVQFDLTMPVFISEGDVHIEPTLLSRVGQVLGSHTLHITTEAGAVSERLYGANLRDHDWSAGLNNILGNTEKEPLARVAANDSRYADTVDWIVINTSEVTDRFQEADALPRTISRAFTQRVDVETLPAYFTWTRFFNQGLQEGIRSLAREKASGSPFVVPRAIGALVLSHQTFAHPRVGFDTILDLLTDSSVDKEN